MKVQVRVHLEPVTPGQPFWWAESDELPGFSAADHSLTALQTQARYAIYEILGELHKGEDVEVEFHLALLTPTSQGDPVDVRTRDLPENRPEPMANPPRIAVPMPA